MLWCFCPPKSRRNISSFCLHRTDSGCILHFRGEVQTAAAEQKEKELGIKCKCLSGGKAEGTCRKLLLGCSHAPLSSSALSNHSTPCLLSLLSSLTISSRPSNQAGEAAWGSERQPACLVSPGSVTSRANFLSASFPIFVIFCFCGTAWGPHVGVGTRNSCP